VHYLVMLFAILFFLSCSQSTEPRVFTFGEPFTLQHGQNISLEDGDVVIGFSDVLEDNRCPLDQECITPGTAEIEVWMQIGDAFPEVFILLIPGEVEKQDEDQHHSQLILNYRVTLKQLDPYPEHPVERDPEEYEATLLVDDDPDML